MFQFREKGVMRIFNSEILNLRWTIWSFTVNCIKLYYWEKNAIESKAFLSKSMYIMDSNHYAIELVIYLLVLVVYFYELIVYMLLERNAFDSIAYFSQCINYTKVSYHFSNL